MSEALTVGKVISMLEDLVAKGHVSKDAPCLTEGCDCSGECVGVEVFAFSKRGGETVVEFKRGGKEYA